MVEDYPRTTAGTIFQDTRKPLTLFRFNRRTSRSQGKLFFRLLQQAVQVGPTTYESMIGGKLEGNHNI